MDDITYKGFAPWYDDLAALYEDKKAGERAIKELDFARLYAANFNHGTDGHSRLILIAKLAELLDRQANLWHEGMQEGA